MDTARQAITREKEYLQVLSHTLSDMDEFGEWDNPRFLKILKQMETEEPFVVPSGEHDLSPEEVEEIRFRYRIPAWTLIKKELVFIRAFQTDELSERAKWLKDCVELALKHPQFSVLVQETKQRFEAAGYRFSVSRFAEPTDVHLWWSDDATGEMAEAQMRKFCRGLVRSIAYHEMGPLRKETGGS